MIDFTNKCVITESDIVIYKNDAVFFDFKNPIHDVFQLVGNEINVTERVASKAGSDNVSTKEPDDEGTFGEEDDAGGFFEIDDSN